MIITVARECGSGGHEIGEQLAKHYNIKCYDRHVLVSEMKKRGLYNELENFLSEKPIDSLLYSIVVNHGVNRNNVILERFREIFADESFVLIGRCGNAIFKDSPDMTSVFIHADFEDKLERTVRKQNMDRIKAAQLLEYVDDKRKSFHKHYTGKEWGDAKEYDLSMNSSVLGIDKTVKQIINFIDEK